MATNNTDQKYLSLAGLSTFWGKVKEYIRTENEKIKVSFNETAKGNLTKFSVDEAGRVISVDESALSTKLTTVDNNISALDARLTAIDKENGELDVLQATVAKLDGASTVEGSVKAQVAAAEAAAKKYTDDLETELRGGNADDSLQSLRADINTLSGNGTGSVADQIDAKINALDVTDTAVAGEYVSAVSETDGKITVSRTALPTYEIVDNADFITVTSSVLDNGGKSFTITTSDIASADALSKLTQDVRALDTAETGRVSVLENKVAALASATHFRGAVESKESIKNPAEGDVVVETKTGKEFIYSDGAWVELGDTTAEQARIGALEVTVNGTEDADGLVQKVAALETAVGGNSVVNTFGGQSGAIVVDTEATGEGNVKFAMSGKKLTATVNIGATAAQGALADSAVQTGAGVDGSHTTTTISKEGTELKVKVDVATVDANGYTDATSTAIPTAGSVMSKINAAITALTSSETETDVVESIVTGVSQANGKITVTKSAFNAITDEEIGKLF